MELELDDVERTIELAASRDGVWAALTEPAGLSAWLGGEVDELDLRPGGRASLRRSDGAIRRLVIEAVEPGRLLRFRWWPFAHPGSAASVGSTRVEFLLEDRGTATVLHVVECAPLAGSPSSIGAGTAVDSSAWDRGNRGGASRLIEAAAR